MTTTSGLQAALSALTSQIRELDAILAVDPENAEIATLRHSIQAEAETFEQDALNLRKRQLLSALADNDSSEHSEQEIDTGDDAESEARETFTDLDYEIEHEIDSGQNTIDIREGSGFRQPEKTSNDFCSWMNHTKGIGLKLLQKHGYVFGAGLGKRQQGRVEPIDIVRRRANAGLDYGSKPKKVIVRNPVVAKPDPRPDVFHFMNAKLNRHQNVQRSESQPSTLSELDSQKNLLGLGQVIDTSASERDRVASALNRCLQQNNQPMIKHYTERLQKIDASIRRLQTMHKSVATARKRQRLTMKSFKF